MTTVRAAWCTEYGSGDGIAVAEADLPPLAPTDVQVDVELAGLGHSDVLVVANRYQVSAPLPFVPGSEFAGVVTDLGAEVAGLARGDRVAGTVFVGACAERVVVPAANLRKIPDGVEPSVAVAGGVAYATAYHALRSVAAVQPGETVIVLGAAGAVGLAAVDIACALGASVVAAAAGTEKLEAAAQAGAAVMVDYSTEQFRDRLRSALPDGADVVIDPVGGRWSEPALRSLRRGGRFVTVGYASGEIPSIPLNLVLLKGISILGFEFRTFAAARPGDFERDRDELTALLAAGRLHPRIAGIHPLGNLPEALHSIADRTAIGKVLIDVRN